ncbi:MAG: SLC13 family permease [Pirellulales bacterium]
MGIDAWISVGVVILVVATLALTSASTDLVMIGGVTLLMTLGVLAPSEALAGFANEGMITVAALFVVAAGIRETGAMQFLVQRLLGRPKSVTEAQIRMMVPMAVMSAFMNNTPLVAMMMPVVLDWARKLRISASKLMMPLSFATILGGLCTLLGTSTNVIVSQLVEERTGQPLQLFDPMWVGLPCAIAGIAYMLLFNRWLLPDRKRVLAEQADPRQYTVEMLVDAGSPLIGLNIEQAGLRHLTGLFLVEIDREGEVRPAISPQETLRAHDRLVFVGVVESVVELQNIRGLIPATNQLFRLDAPRLQRALIEAVVSDTSPLVGQTIRDARFRTTYNAVVIAVSRNGERLPGKIGDITVRVGDTLLLEAPSGFLEQHRNSRDFFLISRVDGYTPLRHERSWLSLAILAAMVLLAATNWLPIVTAALLAAVAMIGTRCCTTLSARRSIDWQMLVAIGGSLALGKSMETSGAAKFIVNSLVVGVGDNPWLALVVIYGVTMLFTEVLSNNAAAVLMFPLAMATANTLDVSYLPFVFGIMMAASCGFATPIGYQTNLMVYGPGGYHFRDYLRFGGMLNLIVYAITVTLVPLVWPFY